MEISPSVLEFKGPFTKATTEYLTLHNNSEELLAFKVKTTAPKLYCVRPNASVVQPGQKLEVSIILQGLKQEPAADFKCKDKFLLVSLPCPYSVDDETSIADLWPHLEKEFKAQSVSKKIPVSYIIENGSSSEPQGSETPSVVPVSVPSTPAVSNRNAESAAVFTPVAAAAPVKEDLFSSVSTPIAQEKTIPQTPKTPANTEIEKDIEASNVKIAALNDKLDSNVKSEKVYHTEASVEPVEAPETVAGVSYPIALILALLAFLIGWLFF